MNEYIYRDADDLKDGISDENCKIVCLKKNEKGYLIHIVCCQFSDENALKDDWKELMYNVADKIQKNLNKIIEIYNVYILFFAEKAGDALVNEIEQNKYSSRKTLLKYIIWTFFLPNYIIIKIFRIIISIFFVISSYIK